MDVRVRNLVAMGKEVFLCGDLNIICSELDTAGLAERLRKEVMTFDDFFSMPSRRFLNQLVFGGHVIGERDEGREEPVLWDLCREFHPTRAGMYTCWETRKNARPGNFGSRIDYVLCSSGIKDWFVDSNIQEGLLGSDHCPVYATIGDTVDSNGAKVPVEDVMNPAGMFKDGERLREWSPKDLLPTSAKLIPEFDRRQSIRDMFFKKTTPSAKPSSISAQPNNAHDPIRGTETEDRDAPPQVIIPSASPPPSQTATTVISNSTTLNRTSSASPKRSPLPKRQAESSAALSRPQKKGKVALNRENSAKSASGFAQSSLKGFFKPKTPVPEIGFADEERDTSDPSSAASPTSKPPASLASKQDTRRSELSSGPTTEDNTQKPLDGNTEPGNSPSTEKVFDPIQAKESWSKLLGKRVIPRCEHGDDCQMLVTKKAGVNCGMCYFALALFLVISPCLFW